MSTQPIDYDALAQQHGAVAPVDYDALAKQHGAMTSDESVQGAPPRLPVPPGLTAPSAEEVAARLTKEYVPAMQMAMGGGGIEKVGATALEAAASPAVRSAAVKAAGAVDPEITGVISPRLANVQRLITKFAGKMKDAGLATEAEELKTALGPPTPEPALLKSRGLATAEIPASQSAAQTGEALAGPPVKPVAQPTPAAVEPAAPPTPAPKQPITPLPLPKGTKAAQVIKTLNQAEALRQPVNDVVDAAIPPTGPTQAANLLTKSRVNFHLQRGDVDAAQAVLESATPKPWVVNKFPPEAPKIVPSVQNIRENDAMVRAAEAQPNLKIDAATDAIEDRATQQEMNWNLEQHGYRAESEARREFIARNSTGMTKGELTRRLNAQKPGASPLPNDLTEEWTKALEAVKKIQGSK